MVQAAVDAAARSLAYCEVENMILCKQDGSPMWTGAEMETRAMALAIGAALLVEHAPLFQTEGEGVCTLCGGHGEAHDSKPCGACGGKGKVKQGVASLDTVSPAP